MRFISFELESRLRQRNLWPQSRTAWAALYVLALDVVLVVVQSATRSFARAFSDSLGGWIIFLSAVAMVLWFWVASRWLRRQMLWRLRNRLIVTYVFIGVIPVLLLVAITLITLYLFSGQFASYCVTSNTETYLARMEASNRTLAHHLQTLIDEQRALNAETLMVARPRRAEWSQRQVCAWYRNETQGLCSGPDGAAAFNLPPFITDDFRGLASDHRILYLRTASIITTENGSLRVISSERLDANLVEKIAGELGKTAVYASGGQGVKSSTSQGTSEANSPAKSATAQNFSAGVIPPSVNSLDREITLRIPLPVVDWATGERSQVGAIAEVATRYSRLYATLFGAREDYARGLEAILALIAIVFAIAVSLALFVGIKLTRSITSAVDQLYEATKHINRADFSHRITVSSSDQLATLANSFNSMTTSIENLVEEQKQKERLEGELAIAQEVQAQLYPKLIKQIEGLEVHGFCRPARTVSGDYYDFLALSPERLMLAVGDISGKGISAALLMATIYSAVRAYTIESLPVAEEAMASAAGAGLMLASDARPEASPAVLLSLLNHQLYEGTPAAKYATLFLGIYDGASRKLTYANGGHLQPILISQDGSLQMLDCGGTVVGLFDNVTYPEAIVEMRRGDILVAYSDGVTEPENDYGEFGEERLMQLVRENRHLALERITEIVLAAVLDWIGENEQPDDVTLVLARAR
jgi:phosphoserine phosphatase RsbU/P